MSGHRVVNPSSLAPPVGFAHAVVSSHPGQLVSLGGQAPLDRSGAVVGETLAEQFDLAAANLVQALEAAGCAPEDLVWLAIYCTDLPAYRASLEQLGRSWRERFGRWFPAMGLFGVTELFDELALVELMGLAVRSEQA